MAIKFVNKTPGDAGGPKKVLASPNSGKLAADAQVDAGDGRPEGRLVFGKSEPKQRGRKKPLK